MGHQADAGVRGDGRLGGPSLSEDVYWQLRKEIVRGDLRPNQPLAEIEIAERLNVSRTPVRESMQRLAADGLVISRRRRWLVYEHSKKEIEEIYEVRLALEGYAARLARPAQHAAAQVKELARIRDSASASGPLAIRVEHNETFHNRLVTIAGNGRLASMLVHNRNFAFNRQVASLYTPDDLIVSADQHARLVDAVRARDGDAAERAARDHIQSALEIIIARLALTASSGCTVSSDLGVGGEPGITAGGDVRDQLGEGDQPGAVADDVRVHRQLEQATGSPGGVELVAPDLQHGPRRNCDSRGREVHSVVADPADRQLNDARRPAVREQLVAVVVRHQR